MFLNFNEYILLLFFYIIFLLKFRFIRTSSDNRLLGEGNFFSIYIQNKFIYISSSSEDFNVYYFDYYNEKTIQTLANYTEIIKNKNIIKVDDNNLVIVGFNNNNYFCYIEYSLSNQELIEINEGIKILYSLRFSDILNYNFRCVSNKNCILSMIDSSNFYVYKITLGSLTPNGRKIDEIIKYSGYTKNNIQCELSSDGNEFVCILSYFLFTDTYRNRYLYGDFINFQNQIFCNDENCFLGNVLRIDNENSNNKFLVCYDKKKSDSLITICRNIYLKNSVLTEESEIEVIEMKSRTPIYERALILQKYKNTIFIENDLASPINGILIIASLDFKISLMISPSLNKLQRTYSFFNDDEYYFILYTSRDPKLESNIYIEEFLSSEYREYSILSSENEIELDIFKEVGGDKVGFSLSSSIDIYQDNNLLNLKENNFIDINTHSQYKLKKKIENGIINNYYVFANQAEGDYYYTSSLINQIKIIICYKTCSECSTLYNSSSTNHYCTKCQQNYYPIYEDKNNNPEGYNCYNSNDSLGYYLDGDVYKPCDSSCKTCTNKDSCSSCKEGYYFMSFQNGSIMYENKCRNKVPEYYYFEYDTNIPTNSVYKPCYNTCKSCSGSGNYLDNKCLECKENFTSYNFDKHQCTKNFTQCVNNNTFWKLEKNNIECIDKCDKRIIISGDNKGQCINDCDEYINIVSIYQKDHLLPYECEGKSYCIPFLDCYRGSFYLSNDGKSCLRHKRCIKVDIFNKSMDPFSVEPDDENPTPIDYESKIEDMTKRFKEFKLFNEEKNDEEVLGFFNGLKIIENYNNLLLSEKKNLKENNGLYLVTSTRYNNYSITIYPLDIEDFTFNQIISPNELGFINFTKMYPSFLNYELSTSKLLLACILERHNKNTSIDDLFYILYSFNEKNEGDNDNLGKEIKLESKTEYLLNVSSKLEVQYPLKNYINKNSFVNKRNSENLVDNIKNINKHFPDVELYNIDDPFFNDICFLFTSDVGTDMTLNDRRNEYYIRDSLCEDNCTIIKIINKDKNPRAVCNCAIKTSYAIGQHGKKDDIPSYSVTNLRSFVCISETFGYNIRKNGHFWILIIILILQIYLLIIYIRHRKTIINKMLGLYDNNIQGSKNEIIKSNSDDSSFSYEIRNHDLENNLNHNNKEKIDSKQEDILSAPANVSNPPRKKIDFKKPNNNSTKTDIKIEEKDLISGNESSIIKGSVIKINERNPQENSEISFEDLQDGFETYKIDNLLEQKDKMQNNNYLESPLIKERMRKMKKIKKALRPLNETDKFKYNETCEDVLYSNLNNEKFNNKRNREITYILGGKDLFKKNLIDNVSDNEEKPRYPKNKIILKNGENNEKGILSDEEIVFSRNTLKNTKSVLKSNPKYLIDEGEGEEKNKVRIAINKNVDELFNLENKNSLAKSLGKKEFNNLKEEEEEKNSEGRIKTEVDIDTNKKIKKELQNIGKIQARPYSSIGKNNKNKKNKPSIESNFNKLMKSKIKTGPVPLIIKDKPKEVDNNKNKNSVLSKESDSKRIVLRFQEEEFEGDMGAQNIQEEKIKKKRSRNLEFLKQKSFFTSITELLETNNQEIKVEDNFILYFWKYFMKRELWILTIINKKENIPYFVRYSCLGFCISFIFLLNCFFFFESDVHKRYVNALSGKKNRLGYYFRKEFGTTICVSLLSDLIKMIIIKLVIYKFFKIGKTTKKMMKSSAEKGLTPGEVQQLNLKRQKYLKDYERNLLIYFACLMGLNIFIAYYCICYAGVFHNSIGAFLYGLLFSLIFSFIFCGVICLAIVSLSRLGIYLNNKCINSAFIVLSTLY